ncbi:hypothetical protein THAOC_00600 [Thalassiosira oceanica]|uniref:Uncharacterized protein n=1 Tax=Thalassiosira oceanica TaxID=159749 RepID=K0TP11_THAOC|nr:hypothetical protein THAOC_00600 [Thalassiosira oceanica]|eukprot:EJK77561.1 hypothetical protein THAOC_00600 [Thalassiosira oceanica]
MLGGDRGGTDESPELKLIFAAQKREELHQQGDKLDQTIQRKEKEIKTMKKTLAQLREQNTSFRSSFHQADMNGTKAQQLSLLGKKVHASEEALFATRKEQVLLQRALESDKQRLEDLTNAAQDTRQKNYELASARHNFEREGNLERDKIEEARSKVILCQKSTSRKALAEMQQRKFDAELLEIQATRIQELLMSLASEFPETIGQEIGPDLEKEGLLNAPA